MPETTIPHHAPGVEAPALAVLALSKRFGRIWALREIEFALSPGDALAVLGPNGAGKTTLLRVLAGLLKPDQGQVLVAGAPVERSAAAHRRRVGLVSHHSLLYDGLTAAENLRFYARLYGLAPTSGAAARALAGVGLADRADDLVSTLSRGMVQRLAVARALLHEPSVLLLDEPFSGLDQDAAAALRGLLGQLRAQRRTMVLVTHNIDDGIELATHVAIQVAGRFVDWGPSRGDAGSYRARYREVAGG